MRPGSRQGPGDRIWTRSSPRVLRCHGAPGARGECHVSSGSSSGHAGLRTSPDLWSTNGVFTEADEGVRHMLQYRDAIMMPLLFGPCPPLFVPSPPLVEQGPVLEPRSLGSSGGTLSKAQRQRPQGAALLVQWLP